MKKWLEKTHGPLFELFRHFLASFFDTDLVSTPGQIRTALIAAFSVFLPWFPIFLSPFKNKYAYLSALESPDLYQKAIRADELWLITLIMSAIGLLAAIKWPSMFPGLRDYRSLAALPLRAYQTFSAKLLALSVVATAAIIPLNILPGVLFPIATGGRWTYMPSLVGRILAQCVACIAGSYFLFFALVALQGLLLIVLRPRWFRFVAGYLQGILVPLMLGMVVLSFSIEPTITAKVLQPNLARWLPPVWFLGLYQSLLGDHNLQMRMLAQRAIISLLISVLLTLATYTVSYHRHRAILLEGTPESGTRWQWLLTIASWLVPQPRRKAIVTFMMKTLAASSQHRTILTGYIGFGVAVLLSGLLGIKNVVEPDKVIAASFIYGHVVVMIFLLVGCRHLFAIPIDLRANWIFRITEHEGRNEWLTAMDGLVLYAGALFLVLIPFPLEFKLMGWRAVAEALLFGIFALLCFEIIFLSWEKLPFTCSHLPGKFPMWIRALQLFALLTLLPIVNATLLASIYSRTLFLVNLVLFLSTLFFLHTNRIRSRGELHLKFEELPEPAIQTLSLLK